MRFQLDPPIDRLLRDQMLALWSDVTDAGGAVGFLPGTDPEVIRPELVRHLVAIAEGRARLLVGRDEEDGRVVATAFVYFNGHRLMKHWIWVYTVMVQPEQQGGGSGRALMEAVAEAGRGFGGIEGIRLTCRGGTGAEHFYAACGYKEVGRVPGAIRTDDGDRDDITMWLPLHT
ncbi:N-acetyltransferase family protein [Streptomyces boninensis]|uniref:GNAT family N-acetyltransferase n=1 Tax=Streptomyces boninensis TaxID=2039455 RepID=UPI003B218DEE